MSKRRVAEVEPPPPISGRWDASLEATPPVFHKPEPRAPLRARPPVALAAPRRRGRSLWSTVAGATARHFDSAAARDLQKHQMMTLVEVAVDPHNLNDLSNEEGIHVDGDDRLRRVFVTLDSFGFERSEFQKLWHWFMVAAALPHIYGERDWPRVQERVLKAMGFDELRSEVLIQTFRRAGKTWSVSMLLAALMLNVPGLKISVISTGGRASGKLLDEVVKFIYLVRGGVSRIVGLTTEKLFVSETPLPRGASMRSPAARMAQKAPGTSFMEVLPNNTKGKCRVGCGVADTDRTIPTAHGRPTPAHGSIGITAYRAGGQGRGAASQPSGFIHLRTVKFRVGGGSLYDRGHGVRVQHTRRRLAHCRLHRMLPIRIRHRDPFHKGAAVAA